VSSISVILIDCCLMSSEQYFSYSQTSIKRSPLGQRKSDIIRQMSSYRRFNSYEIFYDSTRKMWHFNTDDCLVEVTVLADLTIYLCLTKIVGLWFMVFNITFNNISAISWRSVLLVEETGVTGENHKRK
jgi:hypothetical protein